MRTWRIRLLESGAPEALLGQHRIFGPGHLDLAFFACRHGFLRAALGLRLAAADQLLEVLDLFRTQIPPHPRRQSAQGQEPDFHAPQLLHQAVEMREHDADLVLAAFHQPHFVPRVDGLLDQLDLGRSRSPPA